MNQMQLLVQTVRMERNSARKDCSVSVVYILILWTVRLFFQDIFASLHFDDLQVVSPDQATTIYKAIKDKGLPVALVEYEGEQHGFRKVSNYYRFRISLYKSPFF